MKFSNKFRLYDSQVMHSLNFENEFKTNIDKRNLDALLEMKLDSISDRNEELFAFKKLKSIIISQQKLQEKKSIKLDEDFSYLEQLRDTYALLESKRNRKIALMSKLSELKEKAGEKIGKCKKFDGKRMHFKCINCKRIYTNQNELMVHFRSHSTPQESIQKFLSMLDGNKNPKQNPDIRIYENMAEQMQKHTLQMMQKHSEETLRKMQDIANQSLNEKNDEIKSINNPHIAGDDPVISKIQRETEKINHQMEEKSQKTEKMFENFMENLRMLETEMKEMREANYINLKEKAEIDSILKKKPTKQNVEGKNLKNNETPVPINNSNNKDDDLFGEKEVIKGDQSLPSHLQNKNDNQKKDINEKKETAIIDAPYLGSIESDIEDSKIYDDISVGKIEEDFSIDESKSKDIIKNSNPHEISKSAKNEGLGSKNEQQLNENENKTIPNPEKDVKIPTKEKPKSEEMLIHKENQKEDKSNLGILNPQRDAEQIDEKKSQGEILPEEKEDLSQNLSDSVNSEKIREAERKFQELIEGKGKKKSFGDQKIASLAEERLNRNLERANPLFNDDGDFEKRLDELQKNLVLINDSLISKNEDPELKKRLEAKDKKFKIEVTKKLEEFREGSSSIKQNYRKEINLD